MNVAVYLSAISFLLWSLHQTESLNQMRIVSNIKQLISSSHSLSDAVAKLPNKLKTIHPGPTDCTDVRKSGNTKSGVYRIWPINWQIYGSFSVYCDMETDGGAWTVIQRRGDYKQHKDYFYRNWKEYQMGFGNLTKDFWLGNDKIFVLTNQGNYSLQIDMKDKEGNKRYAYYREFWIENEKQLYRLHISGYKGNAGDSLSSVNGMVFTTKDRNNGIWKGNCIKKKFKGIRWYWATKCHNLDGRYKSFADGTEWKTWKGYSYTSSEVVMKIRQMQVNNNRDFKNRSLHL